jgi:tetratricopeptide (TPR) repeat protein
MLEVCRALAKDKSGDNDDAKRIYEHLVKDKSQEPAVYLALREIYVNQKQKGKALSVLEKGLKNAPKSLELSLAYCELLADTNRASEARSLADKLAYENPNEPGPLTTQGFIEEKRQNLEKAQVYYQRAIGLDHTDFMANYRMGRLLYKEAEVSKKKEGNPQSIKELQEKSLQYAEQAALVNPKHFGNNRMLLELYNHLGQSDKAELLKTEMN